jgi:hypothetical protein
VSGSPRGEAPRIEFEPLPLADLMAVLRAREAAGSIKLTPKPAPPAPVKKK